VLLDLQNIISKVEFVHSYPNYCNLSRNYSDHWPIVVTVNLSSTLSSICLLCLIVKRRHVCYTLFCHAPFLSRSSCRSRHRVYRRNPSLQAVCSCPYLLESYQRPLHRCHRQCQQPMRRRGSRPRRAHWYIHNVECDHSLWLERGDLGRRCE